MLIKSLLLKVHSTSCTAAT